MVKITFYSTSGIQVDPKSARSSPPPSPIDQIIDEEIEFYVDPSELIAATIIRSESSASGNRGTDTFYAVYRGEDRASLLSNFATILDNIESGDVASDHSWKFPHDENDDKYEFVWSVREQSGTNLTDIGLSYAEQLSIDELLSEPATLTVGVTGWHSAAISASHILQNTTVDTSLAVSTVGRVSALSDIPLVVIPDEKANFLPIDDETEDLFDQKKTELKDTIVDECLNIFDDRLESLKSEPINNVENDLLALRTYLNDGESSTLRSKSAQELRALIDKVTEGGVVKERYDTKILQAEEISSLRETFAEQIEAELNSIQPLKSKYIDRSKALIGTVESKPLEDQYNELNTVLDILDGNTPNTVTGSVATAVADFLDDVRSSELLSPKNKSLIKDQIRTEAKEFRGKCEREERDNIETEFESAREALREYSLREQKRYISSIEDELSPAINNESSAEEIPTRYEEALKRLEQSNILIDSYKGVYKSQEKQKIQELESKVDAKLYEEKLGKLKRVIDRGRDKCETTEEKLNLLEGVQVVLKTPSQKRELPAELTRNQKIYLDKIQDIVVNFSESELLSPQKEDELCSDLREHCEEAKDELKTSKLSKLENDILGELEGEISNLTVKESLDKISKYKSKLRQLQSKTLNEISDDLSPILNELANMSSPFRGKQAFTNSDMREHLETILSEVEEREEELQTEYAESLEREFNEDLNEIQTTDDLSTQEKLYVYSVLKDILNGGDGKSLEQTKYTGHSENISDKLDTSNINKAVNIVSPNTQSDHLTEDQESDLRSSFSEDIEAEIETAAKDLKDYVVGTLMKHFDRTVLPEEPYDEQTVSDLNDALNDISKYTNNHELSHPYAESNSELYELLPEAVQRSVRKEVHSALESEREELRDALQSASKELFEANLKAISNNGNPLDKIVALKEFQQITEGNRSTWPDLINSTTTNSPSDLDIGPHRSDIGSQADEMLEKETDAYIRLRSEELRNSLEELHHKDSLTRKMVGRLENKIEDPTQQYKSNEAPFMQPLDRLDSKLGRFGNSDETFTRIKDELQQTIESFRQDVSGDYEPMDYEDASILDSVTSKWNILFESDDSSKQSHEMAQETESKGESDTSILDRLPYGDAGATVPIIIFVVAILGGILVGTYMGGMGTPLTSDTPDSPDSPDSQSDPEFALGSIMFERNASGGGPHTYSLQYTVIGGSANHSENHEIRLDALENVSITGISARKDGGDSITVSGVSTITPTAENTGYIVYNVSSDSEAAYINKTVTAELNLEPVNSTTFGKENVEISVIGERGEAISSAGGS